ncbi:MAG: hypothetical protein Q9157_005030 [Trypethelium eluteriae]
MESRRDAVTEAHSQTFGWILEEGRRRDMPEVRFLDWLRWEGGIYWISGKPGSGKSTLMKYLCDQERTNKTLEEWANPGRIIIGHHFFWDAGSQMRKSQEVLLQTLLFQIFCQYPELIFKVVPIRGKPGYDALGHRQRWTRADLMHSVMALKNQELICSTEAVRFCFFIDSLDEFQGAHQEICEMLQNMAYCDHIKLCISSRPWPVLRNAFGKDRTRTLCLQDITRRDIKLFVEDKLGADERYILLRQQEHIHVNLAKEVTRKAQGVFLWVSLVVNELLDSLQNCDTVKDLLTRLRGVPPTLTGYYGGMIDNIHPFYRRKASQTLLLLLQSRAINLPLLALSTLDDETYDDDDNSTHVSPFSEADLKLAASNLRTRLHGRCKDLIEIDQLSAPSKTAILQIGVRFSHRTMVDFLQGQTVHDKLRSDSGPEFDALSTLLRGCLLYLKRLPSDDGSWDMPCLRDIFFNSIERVIDIAQYKQLLYGKVESTLLTQLDRVASWWYQDDHPWKGMYQREGPYRRTPGQDYLAILAGWGLESFIKQRIEANPLLWEHLSARLLLYHATTYAQRPTLVLYLLQKGASPNEEVQELLGEPHQSVWQLYMNYLRASKYGRTLHPSPLEKQICVAKLLIEAGAEPRPLLNEVIGSRYRDLQGEFPEGGMMTTVEALIEVFGDEDGNYLVKLFEGEDSDPGRFEGWFDND